MQTLAEAHAHLFARYHRMIETSIHVDQIDRMATHPRLSLSNLLWMCREGQAQAGIMADDKAGRWLGFVQGCLAMRGLIDVDQERDYTRPLFHAIVKARTGETPPSLSRDGS